MLTELTRLHKLPYHRQPRLEQGDKWPQSLAVSPDRDTVLRAIAGNSTVQKQMLRFSFQRQAVAAVVAGFVGILTLLLAPPRPVSAQTSGGQLKVVFVPPKSAFGKSMEKVLNQGGSNSGFAKIVASLNKLFIFPRDLPVIFRECGFVNAFYSPPQHTITVCYDLMQHFGDLFSKQGKSGTELGRLVAGATLFTFFHEFGHALIGEMGIPATGKEEDAVDEFSTLLLARLGDTGQFAVRSAAYWFALEGQQQARTGRVSDLPFWDEHSLNQQRFYDVICILYGSSQKRYANLATAVGIPPTRAARCVRDYPKERKAWNALLAPHLKRQFSL